MLSFIPAHMGIVTVLSLIPSHMAVKRKYGVSQHRRESLKKGAEKVFANMSDITLSRARTSKREGVREYTSLFYVNEII